SSAHSAARRPRPPTRSTTSSTRPYAPPERRDLLFSQGRSAQLRDVHGPGTVASESVSEIQVTQALADALERTATLIDGLDVRARAAPSPCAGWTVGDVIRHLIAVTDKFTRFAAGETDTPRTTTRADPDGALGPAFRAASAASRRAWARPPTN